ncbi:MAG: vWA domain-containing protein [Fusobacteriaceae bacterium]
MNLPIILLIDTSGSMEENMNILNRSIRELIERFKKEHSEEIKIEIMIITFGKEVKTRVPLTRPDMVVLEELEAEGGTPFKEMLKVLNTELEKIETDNFLAPVFLFLTDGYPDFNDWREEFNLFLENKMVKKGERFSLGIGDGVNEEILEEFASSPENIFKAHDAFEIYDFFKILPHKVAQ